MATKLPELADAGDWQSLHRVLQLLLWLVHHVPGSSSILAAGRSMSSLQAIVSRAASASRPPPAGAREGGAPAVPSVPAPCTERALALLLECARASEAAADRIVESQSLRQLLRLLTSSKGTPAARRHVAEILQLLSAAEVYKDVLQGAGVLDALLYALTDAAIMCDLRLLQELLWTLIALSDNDIVYKDLFREEGVQKVLVALVGLYQSQSAMPELRPISAQLIRCLHLLSHDDDCFKQESRRLGLVRLLVQQLHQDTHRLDEPPVPAAAAASSLAAISVAGRSPRASLGAGGAGSPRAAQGGPAVAAATALQLPPSAAGAAAAAAGGGPVHEVSIPEDEELPSDVIQSGTSPTHRQMAAGRAYGSSQPWTASEAAPLRGFGGGPTPLQRMAAAVLLRAALEPTMGRAPVGILLHGMLLPALHMQLVGPRLSLSMEATAALKSLMVDSRENQEAAMRAGAIKCLSKLLCAHNIDLASQAAEAVTCLGESYPQELAAEGTIEGLVGLLGECADHAHAAFAAGAGPTYWRRAAQQQQQSGPPLARSGGEPDAAGDPAGERGASPGPRPLSASGRRGSFGALPGASGFPPSSPMRRRRLSGGAAAAAGRQRPRVSVQGSVACLVCSADGHESCGFCPMSSALKGLLRLMAPEPPLQARLVGAGGVGLVCDLMVSEIGHPHSRLMQSLLALLSVALSGSCSDAQDEARAAGGIEVLIAGLASMAQGRAAGAWAEGIDTYQLRFSVLNALTLCVSGSAANKTSFREQAGFVPVLTLLRELLQPHRRRRTGNRDVEDGEHLETAALQLLAASAVDSPENQDVACKMGAVPLLLDLLCGPNSPQESPALRVMAATCIGILVEAQPIYAEETVAAGAVHTIMGRLQQERGGTEEQDLLSALARILRGSKNLGRRAAIQMRAVPLLVRMLACAPSGATARAAAAALAEISEADSETRSQVVSAGGMHALMERLECAGGGGGGSSFGMGASDQQRRQQEQQQQTEQQQQQQPAPAWPGPSVPAAVPVPEQHQQFCAISDALRPPGQREAAAAAEGAEASPEDAEALAWVEAALTKAACLQLLSTLAHGNSFAKNSARQASVFELLSTLMDGLQPALEGEAAGDAASAAEEERQLLQRRTHHQRARSRGGGGVSIGHSRHRRVPSDQDSSSGCIGATGHAGSWADGGPQPSQQQQQQLQQRQVAASAARRAELQLLTAAAQCCADLCQGNHTNQGSMAAEGLIERVAALLAILVGAGLDGSARAAPLLSALCDALGSACEFHTANKTLARETGAADALARLLLLAGGAEAAQLRRSGLPAALAAGCRAVHSLVQDCEDNQRVFMRHSEGAFLPALFRLMAAGDANLATQAAGALEYCAIRVDPRDDGEDRGPDNDTDVVLALIKLLSLGAAAAPNGAAGGPSAAKLLRTASLGTPGGADGGAPTVGMVREASVVLATIVEASSPEALAAGGGGALSTSASVGSSSGGGKPLLRGRSGGAVLTGGLVGNGRPGQSSAGSPSTPFSSSDGGRQLQQRQLSAPAAMAGALQQLGGTEGGAVGAPDPQQPQALMPSVVTDHSTGLAVLRTWSLNHDPTEAWRQLVARVAPAFQRVTAQVADGPWRPFRLQLSWMLLLLAAKAPANRMLISKVERASIAPLATQLENAQRCRASGLAGEEGGADGGDGSSSDAGDERLGDLELEVQLGDLAGGGMLAAGAAATAAPPAGGGQEERPGGRGGGGGGGGGGSGADVMAAAAATMAWMDRAPAAATEPTLPAGTGSAMPGGGYGGSAARQQPAQPGPQQQPSVQPEDSETFVLGDGEDDDIMMLQQEVAFLTQSTSMRRDAGHDGAGAQQH